MHPLVIVFALSASASPTTGVEVQLDAQALVTCTAQRLKKFVGPFGVRQAWPVVAQLPPQHAGQVGELLSDQGNVEDGYMQSFHVDTHAKAAYVVQQGGFAGMQTVYGPLPVSACAVVAP
jgi:hypothetical protein